MASSHRSLAFLALFFACMAMEAASESFTYYWTPQESEACARNADTPIQDCSPSKRVIANVCGDFWNTIHTEGAGRLADGRFVTCQDDNCYCFGLTDGPRGSRDNPLRLYVSIAVPNEQKYPFGTTLFVSQLQNFALPGNGGQHNGCVRVEDSCPSCNMDFYVGSESNYDDIDGRLGSDWTVSKQDCQIQSYGN